MHQTGFAILECIDSRLPKFSIHSAPLNSKFIAEAEDQDTILVPTEVQVRSFEERWIGPNGFLIQHKTMLETLADVKGEHAVCEHHAIDYVMTMLATPVQEKLWSLRNVFQMIVTIRAKYGLGCEC